MKVSKLQIKTIIKKYMKILNTKRLQEFNDIKNAFINSVDENDSYEELKKHITGKEYQLQNTKEAFEKYSAADDFKESIKILDNNNDIIKWIPELFVSIEDFENAYKNSDSKKSFRTKLFELEYEGMQEWFEEDYDNIKYLNVNNSDGIENKYDYEKEYGKNKYKFIAFEFIRAFLFHYFGDEPEEKYQKEILKDVGLKLDGEKLVEDDSNKTKTAKIIAIIVAIVVFVGIMSFVIWYNIYRYRLGKAIIKSALEH